VNDKIIIRITKSNYSDGVYNGREYTSVSYSGRTYGGGSPCDTEEEVLRSIKSAEETIKSNGDTSKIIDERTSGKETPLNKWF